MRPRIGDKGIVMHQLREFAFGVVIEAGEFESSVYIFAHRRCQLVANATFTVTERPHGRCRGAAYWRPHDTT